MLAEILAVALVLSAAGPRARPAAEGPVDNASRARRGLLPRKVVKPRPPARARRIVLVPRAPTWLGEPGAPGEVAVQLAAEVVVAPAGARSGPVVVSVADLDLTEARPAESLRATIEGAEVARVLLFRRRAAAKGDAVRAGIVAPEVRAALVRRPASPGP